MDRRLLIERSSNLDNLINAELNPIWHLLALLGAHHILHVGRLRDNEPLSSTYVTSWVAKQQQILKKDSAQHSKPINSSCIASVILRDNFKLLHNAEKVRERISKLQTTRN
jgi:hypothetical protein